MKETAVEISEQIEWLEENVELGKDAQFPSEKKFAYMCKSILASLRRLEAIENAGMPEEPDCLKFYRGGMFKPKDWSITFVMSMMTKHADALRLYAERQALLLDDARALLSVGMYDSEKNRQRMHKTVHAIDALKAGKP